MRMLWDEGDTTTAATGVGAGALTLRGEEALSPSLAAEIMAVPGPVDETSPFWATTATLVFELCQVTVRPTIGAPVESSRVAVACAV